LNRGEKSYCISTKKITKERKRYKSIIKGIATICKNRSKTNDILRKIYLVIFFFQPNPLNFKANIGNLDTISRDPNIAIVSKK